MNQMFRDGYHFVAFPIEEVSDSGNLAYFKTSWEAAEHCFEMSTDVDFYKSLPIQTVISDLDAIPQSGIDTTVNEAIAIIGMAERDGYNSGFVTTNLNNIIMNEKNFDYLKDQVKYTGFGEALEGELRQNIEQQQPAFSLKHDAFYGDDRVSAELNFKKSEQTDLYFFNSYKVQLQKEDDPESLEQTFYINKGSNITLKEAYNLMEGRAVNKDLTSKEGEVYNSWVQLDFKDTDSNGNFRLNHYHENYGYNLESALSKHPIKELDNNSHKEDLMNSLKKGNLQSATFIKDGQEVKQYIEANPQFKTLNVYDANRQRLDVKQGKDQQQSQEKGQNQNQKQSAKQQEKAGDDEGTGEPKQKQQRRKSQSL
jgi:hypothetical protein